MTRPLTARTHLDIILSAVCSRNRYTTHPGPVIDELRRIAAEHTDVLAEVAGSWVGYYESPATRALCDALRAIPGSIDWVEEGRRRRSLAPHKTP